MRGLRWIVCLNVVAAMVGCAGSGKPAGSGLASYYADRYHGRPTASGESFDVNKLTAAHRTLAFGTKVRVTNLENGKSVVVRINDRGPFVQGRVIDLSPAAAQRIEMTTAGVVPVKLEVLGGAQTLSRID
jgi:rare lipoprotein A